MRRLLLALVVVLSAGCSLATAADDGAGFVAADGSTDIPQADRQPAPAIVGPTLDGTTLTLDDLDGPVVVNFWASWCGPCAQEAPHLAAIADEYADRGVSVVGVNVRDTTANALAFEREYGIGYPSWDDESARIASQFGALGPAGLPSTVLLDAEHRVASRIFGAVSARQLAPRLDGLLAEATG